MSRALNGFTDKHLLELIIQKSLILNSDTDLDTWKIQEDLINSNLTFTRVTPAGETIVIEVDSITGNVTFSGSINVGGLTLSGDLDMNTNDIINATNITATNLNGTLQTPIQNSISGIGPQSQTLNMFFNDIIKVTNITATNISGTLQTPLQPLIQSLGTLSMLNVNGNINTTNCKCFLDSGGTTNRPLELKTTGGQVGTRFIGNNGGVDYEFQIIQDVPLSGYPGNNIRYNLFDGVNGWEYLSIYRTTAFGGNCIFGDGVSKCNVIINGGLTLNSTTKAFIPPSMNTTQRGSLPLIDGSIIFNTNTGKLQCYNGVWNDCF